MTQRILVTGGAGYIGSHMLLTLSDKGYEPIVFDSLVRGFRDAVRDVPFIEGDIRTPDDLDRLFSRHPVDLVMHFAALTYVDESVRNPDLYYKNNVLGTRNLLKAMRDYGIDKFVFSSSCAVYGEPREVPIPENHPKSPISPYGENKWEVEEMLQKAADEYALKSVSLRYFNAAGADPKGRAGERHDPETHIIPLVLMEAMRLKKGGRPQDTGLKVFGSDFKTVDGSAVRDYIHVEDLCRAHLAAARRLLSDEVNGAEAYNLANGVGFSVLQLIEVARQVTKQPIEYQSKPRRDGDPAMLIGTSKLARDRLHWSPKYTELSDVIKTAWDWMNKNA